MKRLTQKLILPVAIVGFLSFGILGNILNQQVRITYNAKILERGYIEQFGKEIEQYVIKNEDTNKVDLIKNQNFLFYKSNSNEISKKIKIGETYRITVNSLFLPPPNLISIESSK